LMWRDAGRLDNYGAELDDAFQYANNMKFDDYASVIWRARQTSSFKPRVPPQENTSNEPDLPVFMSENEKREIAEKYGTGEGKPLTVEFNDAKLLINGKELDLSDDPEFLWQ